MGVVITVSVNEERSERLQKKGINVLSNDAMRDYILKLIDKDLGPSEESCEKES